MKKPKEGNEKVQEKDEDKDKNGKDQTLKDRSKDYDKNRKELVDKVSHGVKYFEILLTSPDI